MTMRRIAAAEIIIALVENFLVRDTLHTFPNKL